MKATNQEANSEIFNEKEGYVHSIYPIYTAYKNQEELFALGDHSIGIPSSLEVQEPQDIGFCRHHR